MPPAASFAHPPAIYHATYIRNLCPSRYQIENSSVAEPDPRSSMRSEVTGPQVARRSGYTGEAPIRHRRGEYLRALVKRSGDHPLSLRYSVTSLRGPKSPLPGDSCHHVVLPPQQPSVTTVPGVTVETAHRQATRSTSERQARLRQRSSRLPVRRQKLFILDMTST